MAMEEERDGAEVDGSRGRTAGGASSGGRRRGQRYRQRKKKGGKCEGNQEKEEETVDVCPPCPTRVSCVSLEHQEEEEEGGGDTREPSSRQKSTRARGGDDRDANVTMRLSKASSKGVKGGGRGGGGEAPELAKRTRGRSTGIANTEKLPTCIVCAGSMRFAAMGSCGHMDVCSGCVQKLRILHDDERCCVCMQKNEFVFVVKVSASRNGGGAAVRVDGPPPPTFDDVNALQELVASDALTFDETIRAYSYEHEHMDELRRMRSLRCRCCFTAGKDALFESVEELVAHVAKAHRLSFCDLCMVGKNVFLLEQKMYTHRQLRQHKERGERSVDGHKSVSGFSGHPKCQFCDEYFYGPNEIYSHMQKTHFWCDICRRKNPNTFAYYRDYEELAAHFRADHFPCPHPDCEERKFVVFETEAELNRHIAIEHGGNLSRAKVREASRLPVNFTVRAGSASEARWSSRRSVHSQSQTHQRNGPEHRRRPEEQMRGTERLRLDRAPTLHNAEQRDGNMAILDDDLGWVPNQHASERVRLDETFPSLSVGGGNGTETESAPGNNTSNAPAPARVVSAWGTMVAQAPPPIEFEALPRRRPQALEDGDEAESESWMHRPLVRSAWGTMVAQAPLFPAADSPSSSTAATRTVQGSQSSTSSTARVLDDDTEVSRRRQLADAFGIPENYTGAFAASIAETFSEECVATAREYPILIANIERTLSQFIRSGERRMSFPAMPSKDMRRCAHEITEHFGLVSCSYGNGTKRRVDVFRVAGATRPAVLLSHAIAAGAGVGIVQPTPAPPTVGSSHSVDAARPDDDTQHQPEDASVPSAWDDDSD